MAARIDCIYLHIHTHKQYILWADLIKNIHALSLYVYIYIYIDIDVYIYVYSSTR